MNGTDSAPVPRRRRPVPRRPLPSMIRLWIERVPFQPPAYKFVKTIHDEEREVLAFTIEVDGEIRWDQDATPVLYVGDVPLSHAETLKDGRVRFLAFRADQERIEPGAPISLGWPGIRDERPSTFRYEPPRKR